MNRSTRMRRLLGTELPVVLLLAFALAPYLWMFLTSLKPTPELTQSPITWLPQAPTLEHYAALFGRTTFLGNVLHSLIVACGAVTLGLMLAVPAAYAFSRFRFPGRRVLLLQFLALNMFPVVLLIIPLYILVRWLDLLDTHIALIVGHGTFAIPFSVWMMTSYFNAIPVELDDSAMIDGASRLQAMRLIVMPLAWPGIGATAIYIFVTSWNEYLYALMLAGQEVRTVTVALQLLIGEFQIQWGMLTAGGSVAALPVTILFIFIQRRLVAGLTAGAVKT
jgi:multiple sugar transport system permease protein